jgi:3'-phosphoadenosine 5'-phosphosulfate sulfotransferase (PAPS reductase)/FAD synthetase
MNYDLELKIEDALHRIKDLYTKSNNKCYLSFSGGKDSTVVAHLIIMAQKRFNLPHIDFVFADTQVEYDAIYDFVEWFDLNVYPITIVKPRKPFGQILKEYGKPAISKQKSSELRTWHKHYDESMGAFYKLVKGTTRSGAYIKNRLANKHFHFLHKDIEYKISNICCNYLKKYPFIDYSKQTDNYNYFSGIRVLEGGARSHIYKSCSSYKKYGNKKIEHKMPVYDWTDENMEDFIKEYDIKISKAYTEYGLKRTGCIGCPYAPRIQKNLYTLYKYEPKKYKAVIFYLKQVYMDQGIKLKFDEEYMNEYEQRKTIIKDRKKQMLEKYRRK